MKLRSLFLTIISALAILSCSDAYEVEPGDEITDANAITNIDELESALTGVYASIGGRSFIEWNALFTDEVRKNSQNAGQGVQVHTWSINSSTTEPETYYAGLYGTINRVNTVLERIDNITIVNDAETNAKERVRAELIAIRAMCHFDLLRFFSPSYESSSPGVSLVDHTLTFELIPRSTYGEVITFVKADLATAYDVLSELSNNSDVTRITPIGIQAIRARVALYNKEYDEAITFANEVVGTIGLANLDGFLNIWTGGDAECIFKLKRVGDDSRVGTVFTETDGRVYFNVSTDLFNQYTEGDIRAQQGVLFAPGSSADNIMVGKYANNSTDPQLADIVLFRTGEMYLILSEAYVLKAAPDFDAAEDAINALRAARRIDPSALPDYEFTDVNDAINKILQERRIELAFEGHRFFDLKRFNRGVDRIPADVVLNPFAEDLPAGDYRFTLPIPAAAIQYNSTLEQNPGYSNN